MKRRCGGLGPYDYRCDRDVIHILNPDSTHRQGTATWPQRVYRQDTDGKVYLGLYLAPYAFIWDGVAGFIEVSHGGMGEPITATIEAPTYSDPGIPVVSAFVLACHEYIEEGEMG